MKTRLVIVDLSNFIFRAFYAVRLMNAPDGTPTNAVHGTLSMLMKLFSDYAPTHIFVAKDTPGKSFRHNIYPDYKANREAPPEDLIRQFPLVATLLEKMGPVCQGDPLYEADDLIGSAVTQWQESVDEILIASGDKDLMQFVGGPVRMLDTMKDKLYDEKAVFEKMGVYPKQIVDYLAMVGDNSDNIPGMRGIGAKSAAKLLGQHETLEACIEKRDSFKGKVLTRAFSDHLDDALLSKKLVKIVTNVDLRANLQDLAYDFCPSEDLLSFLEGLGFRLLPKKLREMAPGPGNTAPSQEKKHRQHSEVAIVEDQASLETLMKLVDSAMVASFYTEFDDGDVYDRNILGLGVSFDGKTVFYCPMDSDALMEGDKRNLLKAFLENENLEIFSDHIQRDTSYALIHGIDVSAQTFDVSQAYYNLNSSAPNSLEAMAGRILGEDLSPSWEEEGDGGRESKARYFSRRALAIWALTDILKEDLEKQSLGPLYYELDDLLIPVLARMENHGIGIDGPFFSTFKEEIEDLLREKEREIFSHNGNQEFNLNSPKQVGAFLFESLNLPVVKKTKTGLSTDSEVLVELASRGISPVPDLLLQHREMGKLLSTYVAAIPELVNRKTGRVHTHFNQNIAATGRLSSTRPNLQNIPIRGEMGRRIRKGFVAPEGWVFLGADYSQVELRILAYLSGDETMLQAFLEGRDIHAQTASEVLGVALDRVSSSDRAQAKAVNFGLMYGQSSFGLAKTLRISRSQAREYITKYFERFSQVKVFLDSLKEECAKVGFVRSYFGRKRFLPDIFSKNRTIRANAERMAVNTPIQATAADVIKRAMIRIDGQLRGENFRAKMILQIHDELIFEVPEGEADSLRELVVSQMKEAGGDIPLSVSLGVASNWFDLK